MAPYYNTLFLLKRQEVYTSTITIFPDPTTTVINAISTIVTPQPTTTVIITNSPDPENTIVVDGDGDHGLSGGAIAGIVIGSILGFILLCLLIWTCANCFGARQINERDVYMHDKYRGGRRGRSGSRSHSHSRHRHTHGYKTSRHYIRQSTGGSPYRHNRNLVRPISPAYFQNENLRRASRSRSRSRY